MREERDMCAYTLWVTGRNTPQIARILKVPVETVVAMIVRSHVRIKKRQCLEEWVMSEMRDPSVHRTHATKS
jgi:transposase-like protein